MLKKLAEELDAAPAAAGCARRGHRAAAPGQPASEPRGYSRDTPAPAVFLSRRRLNGEGSAKETHHVEFDLSRAAASAYEPGDAFGIFPNNPVPLVKAIGRHLGIPLNEPITRRRPDPQPRRLAHPREGALAGARRAVRAAGASVAADAKEAPAPGRMAEGEGADGYDVLAALHAFPHLAPPLYRLDRGAGAAAAAALLDLLVAPRQPGPRQPDGRRGALPGRRAAALRRRLHLPGRARAGRATPSRIYVQKAHAFGAAQGPRDADHHGRPGHRHRAVPGLPAGPAGDPRARGRPGCSSATSARRRISSTATRSRNSRPRAR